MRTPITVRAISYEILGAISFVFLLLFLESFVLEEWLLSANVNLTYLFGLMAVTLIAFVVLARERIPAKRGTDVAVMLFAGAVVLSYLVHGTDTVFMLRILVGSIAPYYIARLYTLPTDRLAGITTAVIVSIATAYAVGIWIEFAIGGRAGGPSALGADNPIAGGEMLGLGAVAAFWATGRFRWGYVAASALCLSAQVIPLGARGSTVATVGAMLVITLFVWHRRDRGLVVFAVVGLVAALGSLLNTGGIGSLERLVPTRALADFNYLGPGIGESAPVQYFHYNANVGRAYQWAESTEAMAKSPWVGMGLGAIYSHNIFLEIASSMGLLGLAPFLLTLISVRWQGILRAARRNEPALLFLALFLFAFLYRQTSFALDAHKTVFVLLGLLVNSRNYTNTGVRTG